MTLAPVKSMAEPLGQAATHAPQPMQMAASIEACCTSGWTGCEFGSGFGPGADGDVSAGLLNPVESGAVDHQVA